jgi:hypothetical protein
LNAGEFVIPKDVAQWKGQEFFYQLMAKARRARAESGNGAEQQETTGYANGGNRDSQGYQAGGQVDDIYRSSSDFQPVGWNENFRPVQTVRTARDRDLASARDRELAIRQAELEERRRQFDETMRQKWSGPAEVGPRGGSAWLYGGTGSPVQRFAPSQQFPGGSIIDEQGNQMSPQEYAASQARRVADVQSNRAKMAALEDPNWVSKRLAAERPAEERQIY